MKKFIRNIVFKNWELKLLSLLLALIIWISLIPEEKTFSEKTLTVPLETVNIPPDMELVEKPEAQIDVTIRAPNRLINEISSANVFAKLNLQEATVFQQEYPLNDTMISIPPGATVVRISPNQVKLKLERTKEELLEIVPNLIGQVQEGYKIVRIEVVPSRVPVAGPESKIKDRDKVSTSPINISGLSESSEFEADLILPKPDLRLASSRNKVKVRVLVEEIKPPVKLEPKKAKKKR
jgi:YbbR domain-containing protein